MTEQELLDAIRGAKSLEDSGVVALTTSEISEATGLTTKVVRRKLKSLIGAGKVVPVWVRRDTIMTPLNGRTQRVPGYTINASEIQT